MMPKRRAAIALLGLLLVAGCTKQVHPKHPNQLNDLDGYAYDSLTIAQASLTEAKNQFITGKFNDRRDAARAIINNGGAAYDVARTGYVAYRDVLTGINQGDLPSLENALRNDLQELAQEITKVQSLNGGK